MLTRSDMLLVDPHFPRHLEIDCPPQGTESQSSTHTRFRQRNK